MNFIVLGCGRVGAELLLPPFQEWSSGCGGGQQPAGI